MFSGQEIINRIVYVSGNANCPPDWLLNSITALVSVFVGAWAAFEFQNYRQKKL
jgi:hypothetical protein